MTQEMPGHPDDNPLMVLCAAKFVHAECPRQYGVGWIPNAVVVCDCGCHKPGGVITASASEAQDGVLAGFVMFHPGDHG